MEGGLAYTYDDNEVSRNLPIDLSNENELLSVPLLTPFQKLSDEDKNTAFNQIYSALSKHLQFISHASQRAITQKNFTEEELKDFEQSIRVIISNLYRIPELQKVYSDTPIFMDLLGRIETELQTPLQSTGTIFRDSPWLYKYIVKLLEVYVDFFPSSESSQISEVEVIAGKAYSGSYSDLIDATSKNGNYPAAINLLGTYTNVDELCNNIRILCDNIHINNSNMIKSQRLKKMYPDIENPGNYESENYSDFLGVDGLTIDTKKVGDLIRRKIGQCVEVLQPKKLEQFNKTIIEVTGCPIPSNDQRFLEYMGYKKPN